MYRRNINIKPKCVQQTGKALSNHESFSPSKSHETVPLNCGPDQGCVVDTFCLHRYNSTHCGPNLYNSVLVLLFTWYNSAAILILSFMFFPRWLLAMELL
jgi:hypothetical protein